MTTDNSRYFQQTGPADCHKCGNTLRLPGYYCPICEPDKSPYKDDAIKMFNPGARAKREMIDQLDGCTPNGTCYDLDEARRALRDRPSLELELEELRKKLLRFEGEDVRIIGEKHFRAIQADLAALREEREDFRKGLRAIWEIFSDADLHMRDIDWLEEDCKAIVNQIAALREENERLKGALREIEADLGRIASCHEPTCVCVACLNSKAARAALEEKK